MVHIENNNVKFLQELEDKGVNAEVITQLVKSANDEVSEGKGEMIKHI